MKKFVFQAILLLVIIAGAIFFFRFNPTFSGVPFVPQAETVRQVQINEVMIRVEIADTKEKRAKGLGGKEKLASDEGMLFIFPETGKHPFWMKGLNFALDFIWIRGNRVVDLTQNALPPNPGQIDSELPIYQSKEDVDKVLEVLAGTIQNFNIQVGDTVKVL